MLSRRKIEQTVTMEGQKDFSTGHVFGAAVRLEPVPFLAEDFRYLRTAFIPMGVDSGLNEFKIWLGDCPCSYGDVVMGSISVIYQKESEDASQKLGQIEKTFT